MEYLRLPGETGILLWTVGDAAPPGFKVVFATKVTLAPGGPRFVDYGYSGGGEAAEARRKLCLILGLPFESLTSGEQVHSANVAVVDRRLAGSGRENSGDRLPGTDAMVTGLEGVPLAVFTADCVPILLVGPAAKTVAAVHAGWRGIVAGIIENTIGFLEREYDCAPRNLRAYLGPCIGPCCYEVREDLVSRLSPKELAFVGEREGRRFLNLKACCAGRIAALGVEPSNIWAADACTRCLPELFFSHRGDGQNKGSNISIVARND